MLIPNFFLPSGVPVNSSAPPRVAVPSKPSQAKKSRPLHFSCGRKNGRHMPLGLLSSANSVVKNQAVAEGNGPKILASFPLNPELPL